MEKTKESNTFCFQSFGERIQAIDLRRLALYRVGHGNEDLEEDVHESLFHQTLKKWMVLNLTNEFSQFSRKVQKIVTLPQLVHQKDDVVNQLLEHLSTATTLSMEPCLELLYILASDLREDFYPYFQKVLDCLIGLLNTTDANQVEWTFVCLAYLFKFLKPFLKRNIDIILYSILPLLDDTKYPEHVMNFAVECFSFIARDIRDHREFLKFLVTSILPNHLNALQSCGRLIFEIIRGVRGQFHSTAPDFLQILMKFLLEEKSRTLEQQNLLNEMLKFSIDYLLKFIQPQQMSAFWSVLCSVAAETNETNELRHIVQIYHQIANYRNGKYLADMEIVVPSILRLLNLFIGNEEANDVLEITTEMVGFILLSYSPLITQLDVSRLLKKILTIAHPQRKIYDRFIIQMLSFAQFDIFLMPSLISYFENNYDCQSIELMANVLIQKQLFRFNTVQEQNDWKSLNIQLKNSLILQKIEKALETFQIHDNNEENLLLLIIATHLKDICHENICQNLEKQISEILSILHKSSGQDQKFINLLTFLIEIECQFKYILKAEIIEEIFKILTPFSTNFMALNSINRLIIMNGSKLVKRDELVSNLVPLLLHHEHKIRLLAAHSIQILHTKQELTKTPYNIFYQIECIEPNVQSYREQIVHLHKLTIEGELYKSFAKSAYKDHVLYFLLGLLHHNFKLLWDPVLKLLEDYAKNAVEPTTFWTIYHKQLENINSKIVANEKDLNHAVNNCNSLERYWSSETLNTLLPEPKVIEKTATELFNYRNLLWQRLAHFGKIFELNNREIVTIFLRFISDEYQSNCEIFEHSWNLSQTQNSEIDVSLLEAETETDIDNNDNEECMNNTKTMSKYKSGPSNSYVKWILQTLYTQLGVFAAHNNPKALYREPELWNLYMRFLSSNNGLLQKLSLDCVMSYKLKTLIPYKDFLYNLLNDKQFKEELINFKMSSVEAEHRDSFTKILLRILYGKMMSKGSQKSISAQHRKSLVLRFMGQCEVTEIEWFLQMAFGSYEKYTSKSVNILEIPAMVHNDFKLETVWSPKKLQSALNLLELIRREFVGIMNNEFHLFILKIITFIGSFCNEVLNVTNIISNIHPKMPFVFRNTKQLSIQVLYNFFTHIDEFAWSNDLMKCITNVFIFPNLEKLPQDSIHNPTVVLKFLLAWGENVKYFSLFAQENDKGQNIFSYIMALLLNPKAKVTVKKAIITLVERLLIAVEVAQTENTEQQACEWGLVLIKPHLSDLLQRFKINLSSRGSKQSLDKQELKVLSMLTKHVRDASTCDQLLQILLPILIARTQTQIGNEIVQQIINTLANLMRCLESPEEYLVKIAPLFEHILEVSSRKLLCELIANIARIKHKQDSQSPIAAQLKYTGRVVFLLNAWDKRWVEQPDYEKRLEILRELTAKITDSNSNNEIDLTLGILVIYNCFYIFRNERDIGLRDNAGEHLRLLVSFLINKYSSSEFNQKLNYLLEDVLFKSIQRAIRSPNEKLRYESIRLLGEMARKCPNAHIVLSDLHPLTDAQDAEVDFFENMVYIQTYRHGRALLKFCSHVSSLKAKGPHVRTLMQFILPLASRYLFQDEQHTKHTLVDAAIETIGIICQLLPWQQYHTLLRYYLTKMRTSHDHQKQCVRLMVRILDAFHFNLSLADPAEMESLEKLKNALQEPICDDSELEKEEDQEKIVNEEGDTSTKDENGMEDKNKNELSLDNENSDEEDILEANLNDINDDEEPNDDNKSNENSKDENCLTRITLLSKNASKRVLNTISTGLIPALNRSITERSSYDIRHKVNRKRFSFEREEDETLRVPIALALVKLMQKLPAEFMETSLPGVFMKVCTFLRSPLKSVRMLTRDMLKKIMLCLSSKYLPLLMDHLQALLTRGFQVHVLTVTVHGVLDALRDQLQPIDLEKCLHNILDVSLNDIFGEINAQKEVDKLVAHTPEAKPSAKSFLVLQIIARNIRESCLLDLLIPFREQLARSKLRKLTIRIQECFSKIVSGLVDNPNLSIESLLIFIHGTISQSITDLIPRNSEQQNLSKKELEERIRKDRPDCFIIPPQPRMRSGAINKQVKNNAEANAHILIEFGLEMLHIVLKRKKVMDINYEAFLNPLLPLLYDSLQSSHSRIIVFAMKTFASIWVEGYKLPKLSQDNYINNVAERLFEILRNLSMFGATNQVDNQQLMHSILKGIVSLLRHCPYYKPTNEQMAELMVIIEQDLQEGDCQAMTFNLLKAIISRNVHSVALGEAMKKIGGIAVLSNWENTREECRNLLITYLTTFPMKKRYESVVKFFIGQLCYSVNSGRLSTIEFLSTIIKKTKPDLLESLIEYLYLSLGTSLVNDEDNECRKAVANCIELLISNVNQKQKDYLFDITILFFKPDNKPSVREMGAALCSRYLNVEKEDFSKRLEIVLEKIVERLTLSNSNVVGRYVRAPGRIDYSIFNGYQQLHDAMKDSQKDESNVKRFEKALDHEVLQMQYCLLKIFEYCNESIIQNEGLVGLLDELAYESQRMLGHEHIWVRCNAAMILSHLIGTCLDFGWIAQKLSNDKQIEKIPHSGPALKFIYDNPHYDIKSLILDLCAQVIPGETSQLMIDEIIKIFLFMANILKDVTNNSNPTKKVCENEEDDANSKSSTINLSWLIYRLRYLIYGEVSRAIHCTRMRMSAFTLMEGLITLLDLDSLKKISPLLLPALVREMSDEDQNIDPDLKQAALRVVSRLRKRIGQELYDQLRTQAQLKITAKRAERRKILAQEKVQNPVRAAKRKAAAQERKKTAKKLKTNIIRGKVADTKQKMAKRKRKAENDSDIF